MKFYKCATCGKIITIMDGSDTIPTICCGKEMQEYVPNTTEGAGEKHLPVYSYKNKDVLEVTVGEIIHPSMENHYIKWILLETNKGFYTKCLKWSDTPIVDFLLEKEEKPVAVYELCNIHGLWMTKIK